MWINGMYEKKPLLVKGRGVDEGVDNFQQVLSPVFPGVLKAAFCSILVFC